MTPRATLLLLTVGCIWGASFLFIRVAIDEVQPLQIVFVRTFAGALVMLTFLRVTRRPLHVTWPNVAMAAGLASLAILVPFFLIAWAEREIDSGTAAILNATMPLFTLFFAAVLLADEHLTAARITGVVLGLAGVVVLIGGEVSGEGSALSIGAMVLSSACYGLAAVGGRVLVRRWNPVSLSTTMVSFAALYSSVIFFSTGDLRYDISLEAWLAMMTLGILGTGLTYVLYYLLIDMVSSVRASFVSYIIPVVGVILGIIVLGESMSWHTVVGGAIILAGVAIGTGAVKTWPRRSQRELQSVGRR
jgi:drug/metabolite transporter (DMT)-like permease